MKKIILAVLCVMLVLAMCACSKTENNNKVEQTQSADKKNVIESTETTQNDVQNAKEQETAAAKMAYEKLLLAENTCCEIMDTIYAAWHFAVYESGNYSNATECYEKYIEVTQLDYDSTLDILNTDLVDLGREVNGQTQIAYLEDISTAVDLVLLVYYDNGVFAGLEECLGTAKESLKSVTDQYKDATGYDDLKKYYVEIESYFEYIKNPTGSFDDLGALVNNYETNMRTYRKSLEFIF